MDYVVRFDGFELDPDRAHMLCVCECLKEGVCLRAHV